MNVILFRMQKIQKQVYQNSKLGEGSVVITFGYLQHTMSQIRLMGHQVSKRLINLKQSIREKIHEDNHMCITINLQFLSPFVLIINKICNTFIVIDNYKIIVKCQLVSQLYIDVAYLCQFLIYSELRKKVSHVEYNYTEEYYNNGIERAHSNIIMQYNLLKNQV